MAGRSLVWVALAAISGASSEGAAGAEPSAKGREFFEKKIRPVLVEHCYKCHSTDSGKAKGGLRVDSSDGLLNGGESGASIIPGDPDGSLLLQALRHDGLEMPPEKKLPERIVEDFAEWIQLGAPDPRTDKVTATPAVDVDAARKFWAFQLPQRAPLPTVKDEAWPRRELDRFVLAGLDANGLKPVADADRRVLARRLYFDLIGLPPTPREMAEFLADESPQSIEHLADRLLDSPHYGERWGRHWLDVSRFAESNGNADNVIFGHAWRYRDYVIAAMNADTPYNQFITEQLAGDLLPATSPAERDRRLIATGFLALGSKPRPQNNPDFQMDVVAEQLEVATTGLMALTVACARCHDHKFDPILTSEYYAMAGIFTSTQTLYGPAGKGNNNNKKGAGSTGLHRLESSLEDAGARHDQEQQLAAARKERDELLAALQKFGATMDTGNPGKTAVQDKKQKKKNQKKPDASPTSTGFKVPANASPEDVALITQLAEQLPPLESKVKDLESAALPTALAMGARDGKGADCKICLRGDSRQLGDSIPRGFVSIASNRSASTISGPQSGRLELAQWIASPDNPLTARVMVNRIWRHLMGRGLVATVDNFGALGEKPSHPELLDYLALKFIDQGWFVKRMIREIVLSRAYALSSDHQARAYEQDPDNVYVWRHSPQRLDAESLRDAILSVSGQLVVEPIIGSTLEVYAGQDLKNAKINLNQIAESKGLHRSVYLPVVRNKMPEVLELFDVADPSLVVGSRDTTTVPSQSLYLMNSPMVIKQSANFAARLLERQQKADGERIQMAFQLAFARDATADEVTLGQSLVAKARAAYEADGRREGQSELRAWSAFCQALYASAEFRYVE